MTIPCMAEVIALGGFSSIEERCEALDSRLKALGKNTTRLGSMLRAYSQLLGTHASMAALRRAMGSAALDRTTLSSYHAVLEEGGIIRDLPPCTPVLTSPTPVLKAPCRQLSDPVIACSVLALSANDLLDDLWRRWIGSSPPSVSVTLAATRSRLAQRFAPIATRAA